ncbi:bifunctional 3,4-dihydroxy-2-butanone-4-phosphate synthase/GTP cyclohydrolase II [Virgibacillus phasianinus]|uniref:Riboflavin biosynthesis protein RibBA n=1 Tax=Virgibacillus phasianinus TaxID=2017483 RepID=A0A220TZB2_9BACI|nr:bifunctional 3,4-dihydroxy-2-butanone-4-phosphate synthase/GTP cyclohydrolase II [Virgibacillus phasianinus]ASK61122.1 bifunctional 3,4-dihydroxy-2-butanone-4-phosphate synthase/GTP cyclohydrolase II [Virgibacillus phasianinus]
MFHSIEEALIDLKNGKSVIVVDDENRENEGDLVALSDMATPETINFMITHGKGLVCTSITEDVSARLNLALMTNEGSDPLGTAFTVSVDHKESTTGISAAERSKTIKALADPNSQAGDFKRPGHAFPLIAKNGGVLTRQGHTEASVDLARLSGANPSGVICEIIKEDGTMARVPDLKKMASQFNLKLISIEDLVAYRKKHEKHVKREVETGLPTEFGNFKVIGYSNDIDDKEHIALVKGEINPDKPILIRVHSECLTGDVFGSKRCDCGPQLHQALADIEKAGNGVLIYMRQEGRGIGLLNKLKAYKLQEEGYDTVEANEQLGFAADQRDYLISAQILQDMGIKQVNVLTNNPEKITALENYGIEIVERIPLTTTYNEINMPYMQTKYKKMGHLLELHN